MTYDGRCSSAPVTSTGVERCVALLAIRRVQRVAHIWSEAFRPRFHGAPCVRLNSIASHCGQTSHFSLSVKSPWIIFIAKLIVSQCFAIHDRRSMWSACYPCLLRPGLLPRPSTPLNNPSTRFLLSTAFLHLHLFLIRLPSSFSPSSSNVMTSPHNSHDNTGAASSAPSDRGSSSRSVRPLSSQNFNRLFGGSLSLVPPFRLPHRNPKTPLVR